MRRQSSKFPSIVTTRAPYAIAWLIFPGATLPCGTSTTVSRPVAAPNAAADALVFPVDAHSSLVIPRSIAFATATTIPRSLNEPVGLQPSSLKYSAPTPSSPSSRRDLTRGVSPSPIVTEGVSPVTGR